MNHEELCVQHGQGQHKMEQTRYMDVVETLFCLTDADGCPEIRCHGINKSREYASQSVQCSVPWFAM